MSRIRTISVQGHSILVIDYSNLKEPEMIQLAIEVKAHILSVKMPQLIINNFRNTYISSGYLRHMERETVHVEPFIKRNVLVGLNTPKMMILKGFNLLLGTDYQAFSDERSALEYLIQEPLSETINPIFKV
jgi:hypothetical protein